MAPIKHGKSGTPLYNVWKSMRQRCNNPKSSDYRWYGQLGINVCREWDDYQVFEKWALESGYQRGLTIDRKNENRNYCPDNCAWITIIEQQNHKRNRTIITYNGETKSLVEWAKIRNISPQILRDRMHRKWPISKMLTTPNNGPGRYERRRPLGG